MLTLVLSERSEFAIFRDMPRLVAILTIYLCYLITLGNAQMTATERIHASIKERIASASNHAVIHKNAESKRESTIPKPQPKKRATYSQQKKAAEAMRGEKKKRK